MEQKKRATNTFSRRLILFCFTLLLIVVGEVTFGSNYLHAQFACCTASNPCGAQCAVSSSCSMCACVSGGNGACCHCYDNNETYCSECVRPE